MAYITSMIAVLFRPLERGQVLFVFLVLSALLSAILIVVLMPLLRRYALARPNARSSHRIPTPQGGGIAVIAATCLPIMIMLLLSEPDFKYAWESGHGLRFLWLTFAATIGLAIVGAVDDIRPLPVLPRLLLQLLAVMAIAASARGGNFLPLPDWIAVIVVYLAGLWFVNLVNFMDGLDCITIAEMVPITAFVAILGWFGFIPLSAALVAAALCGALLGFAPFNRPVAKLFLGDVGSLPIGLLVGWMLLQLAGTGAVVAAILLPLYHLMDATITLLRRLARGEKVWEAHRSHFYQQATNNGFTALSVSAHVFGLNLALAGLAAVTLLWPSWPVQAACLTLGVAIVAWLLSHFAKPRLQSPA
ncbi:glycosyl transferase [Microvirga aerophila]|uniref:Glycosyl transferase n=2 Tax=Microvirga aerophila TaxID=670291 RepID=A0A512BT40_9HYPH|nr:glycosyl transferase [Microvirga aerophila]